MARRLTTDAKIVLERAGYAIAFNKLNGNRSEIVAYSPSGSKHCLFVSGGTVDNDEVMKLLDTNGYCEEDGRFHPTDADIGIYD